VTTNSVFSSTTGLTPTIARAGLFTAIWLALAGADGSSWIIGIPAIVLATLAALRLAGPRSNGPRLLGMLRFVPYFLIESIRGGIDVASRVMRPRLRIAPGISTYDLRLTGVNARVFFLDSVSLLPGTLSADLRGARLYVHALDINDDIDAALRRLEAQIADLFGEPLVGELREQTRRD
jgi:multicomponent Na+:H+ antiporter subunit E